MYKVKFYKDKNGNQPTKDFIQNLDQRTDKNSKINVNKIYDYINYLKEVGPEAREPFAKHLDGEIWELRPIRNRILYASWDDDTFIILHHFIKKTQKTPASEIKQAKRNLNDEKKRSKENEENNK